MGDVNNDGNLNILVLGTTESINDNSEEFSPCREKNTYRKKQKSIFSII